MVSQSESRDVPPWLPEHFVGGHIALDFTNTISHRANPDMAVDRFNSLEKVASWFSYLGMLPAAVATKIQRDPALQDQVLPMVTELASLRTCAGDIFDAVVAQENIPATAFGHVLGAAASHVELLTPPFAEDPQRFHLKLPLRDLHQLVGLIALSVLDAFYLLPHKRINSCPGCRWLFFDSSRGGRRKWCSMRDCGNRAKVRRHYHTHKSREVE